MDFGSHRAILQVVFHCATFRNEVEGRRHPRTAFTSKMMSVILSHSEHRSPLGRRHFPHPEGWQDGETLLLRRRCEAVPSPGREDKGSAGAADPAFHSSRNLIPTATSECRGNQRVLLDYESAGLMDQVPDGMTIDVDGNLWVACFSGSQVISVDPKVGKVLQRVPIPSKNITSACWGGPDYATLYVTSGTLKLSQEEIAANPSAGGTFAITGLGTKGLPPVSFKVDPAMLKAKMDA